MSTQIATEIPAVQARRSARAWVVGALAPVTAAGGIAWAVFQPYRLTLLHPHGESFWWLVVEPPLLVVLVAILFHLVVAPGVIADLERAEEEGERVTRVKRPRRQGRRHLHGWPREARR